MCFWHQIDRRENNKNADQYLSLYYWLRLFSATDFDDKFVWSVLKLTLYEPNYKEKEVHWPIRKTNSELGSEFFALSSLARFGWVCMKYVHFFFRGHGKNPAIWLVLYPVSIFLSLPTGHGNAFVNRWVHLKFFFHKYISFFRLGSIFEQTRRSLPQADK